MERLILFFFFFFHDSDGALKRQTSRHQLSSIRRNQKNVEKGVPPPVQHGPAGVLELGAGGDRARPEEGTGGRV